MICDLDESGFCKRHGKVHAEPFRELALHPTSQVAEKYRQHWDVEAGLLTQEEWDRRWLAVAPASAPGLQGHKPRLSIAELAAQKKH